VLPPASLLPRCLIRRIHERAVTTIGTREITVQFFFELTRLFPVGRLGNAVRPSQVIGYGRMRPNKVRRLDAKNGKRQITRRGSWKRQGGGPIKQSPEPEILYRHFCVII
jgi:hypothetical protein